MGVTFSHNDYVLILIAAIGGLATLGVGILNYFTAHRNRKLILAETDTFNGRKLGETVHDIAATTEIVAAQVHVMQGWMLNHDEKHGIEARDELEQNPRG